MVGVILEKKNDNRGYNEKNARDGRTRLIVVDGDLRCRYCCGTLSWPRMFQSRISGRLADRRHDGDSANRTYPGGTVSKGKVTRT